MLQRTLTRVNQSMSILTILDRISLPGRPDKPNEDAMGEGGSVAFVLDGATGLGDLPLMRGESDAAWVARAAASALSVHAPGFAGDLDSLVYKAATDVERQFRAERQRDDFESFEIPWATLAICGVTSGLINVAFLGDSRLLVRDEHGAVHHFGAPLKYRKGEQALAQKMIAEAKGERLGIESIRASVLPQLRASRAKVNTPEGYWLMGPDPRAAAHVVKSQMRLGAGAMVLMMTDGFYALIEDYKLYDDAGLIKAALGKGLSALGDELREIELNDPMGKKFPRMKTSDDATAMLVRAEG
jgi:serine/threonine protein phosphatase PrpC